MIMKCVCGDLHTFDNGGWHVIIKDGPKRCLALGPFATHVQALVRVDAVRHWVVDNYCKLPDSAPFYEYWTGSGFSGTGRLNDEILTAA
jgi:hypothetical protein